MQSTNSTLLQAATVAVTPSANFAALMRRRGKSFYLASLVLPRVVASRAVALYAFCRQVDDIADGNAPLIQKQVALNQLLAELSAPLPTLTTVPADSLAVYLRQTVPRFETVAAQDLVQASLRDAENWPIKNEADLLDFCYGVAGTVGVMMCPVLGVNLPSARSYAANLGIAMQLTNIARDVLEDATMGRYYIPQTWLQPALGMHAFLHGDDAENARAQTFQAVLRLISLADTYYVRAEPGFGYIPWRARFAIFIAARVYRAIGVKIARNHAHNGAVYWQARTVVSPIGKAIAILDACWRFSCSVVQTKLN